MSFLSQGGSSIEWAGDQILRSDICKHDVVIWGITGLNRLLHYDNNDNAMHILPGKFNPGHPFFFTVETEIPNRDLWLKLLDDESRLPHSIRIIAQVISYCTKVNCHLILCFHPELSLPDQSTKMLEYLKSTGLYVDLYQPLGRGTYIDYASDNKHPGVQTHKIWAETLVEFIKHKEYINEA